MVGNNRNAEMKVVKVKPQRRKNCEVNSGGTGAEEPENEIRRLL
jgi:hypothetical protein